MSKHSTWHFDAAGWLFWLALFVLLIGPCIYAAWQLIYETYSRWYPGILGAVMAAVGAGVISAAVNAVLERRRKKQRMVRRKKARRQR